MDYKEFIAIRDILMLFSQHKIDPSFSPEFKKVVDKSLSVIMKYFRDNYNPPESSLSDCVSITKNGAVFNEYMGHEVHTTDGRYLVLPPIKIERK